MSAQIVMTEEASAPAAPGAGKSTLYFKTDSKLYRKDDAGNEVEVGGTTGLASIGLATALALAL